MFHCLRKPDEISFAGGVFVVIRCEDATSWDMLAQKGHIVSRTGENAMVFLPRHLLGLEAATSILDAAIHNVSGYGSDYRPRYDLIAVATEDLPAGTVLSMGGHHHTISGVTAEFRPAEAPVADAPAPFYLAADCRLAKAVRKGEEIRMERSRTAGEIRPFSLCAAGRMRASSDNMNDTNQPECLNEVSLTSAARPFHGRPRGSCHYRDTSAHDRRCAFRSLRSSSQVRLRFCSFCRAPASRGRPSSTASFTGVFT